MAKPSHRNRMDHILDNTIMVHRRLISKDLGLLDPILYLLWSTAAAIAVFVCPPLVMIIADVAAAIVLIKTRQWIIRDNVTHRRLRNRR